MYDMKNAYAAYTHVVSSKPKKGLLLTRGQEILVFNISYCSTKIDKNSDLLTSC